MRSGLLSAALAALLVLGSGCKKEIYHGLTESEANEIVVALADAEISSDKIAAGADKRGALFTIAVEEELDGRPASGAVVDGPRGARGFDARCRSRATRSFLIWPEPGP